MLKIVNAVSIHLTRPALVLQIALIALATIPSTVTSRATLKAASSLRALIRPSRFRTNATRAIRAVMIPRIAAGVSTAALLTTISSPTMVLFAAITTIRIIPTTAASSISSSASQIFLIPRNAFGNLMFFPSFFLLDYMEGIKP